MKEILKAFLVLLAVAICVWIVSSEAATLNLRATWTANTEPDMASYRLYRTDGTRTLIGTIAHPTTSHNFSVTVPDGSTGTLKFVLQAGDTNNNWSLDSVEALYPYNTDVMPPPAPRNLSISLQ